MATALSVGVALTILPAAADPGDEVVASGRIQGSNVMSKGFQGFTEASNPCGQPHERLGDTSGIDGQWVVLPPEAGKRAAVLRTDAIDADVWFYVADAEGGCALIGSNTSEHWRSMATAMTADEFGTVPAGATHAIVDVVLGHEVTFTFTLD